MKGGVDMLGEAMAVPTVAVTDLEGARQFYEERLGLEVLEAAPFAVRFRCGDGQTSVRRGAPNVGQTVLHFEVDDLDAAIAELVARGIAFEEYETPKTVDFVARIGPARGAWFKDPAGNVIGLREGPVPGRATAPAAAGSAGHGA